MSLAGPAPVSSNPFVRLAGDLRAEREATVPFPPGQTRPSLARTQRFARDPLPLLLDLYERFGPVFTVRIFHGNNVFALGPEANHHITVSHAANYSWRDGGMGDLMPLLGDGLLTDRRRLPPQLAQDHAARLPPRAHRSRPRDHGGRDGRRPRARARR